MSSVQRSSLVLAGGTIVSRILGFVRAILLVVVIGNTGSPVAAAFGVANGLPNNVYILVAGGVLSAVLVPQIVKASKSADAGQAYVSKLVTLGGTVFTLLTLAATLAAPWLVDLYAASADGSGRGFTPEQMALAIAFAYWCLPQILFYALYTLIGEIFNARGQFGPYTWAPVANNIISIAGLVVMMAMFGITSANDDPANWTPERIAILGAVTTGGVILQALVLVVLFRRTGLEFRLDFGWRGVGLRATGQRAMWIFGVVVIGQLKGLFQSNVVTLAGQDDANAMTMQNAWYIFSLPHSIIAVSIAIAYFTRMSQHASNGALGEIRTDVAGALRGVGMLTTISAFALAVVATPLLRLFDRNWDNLLASSIVLWAMLPCLVAFSAEYVLQRVFFALDDTRTPFLYALFGLVVTFGLLWACTTLPPDWVVAGAALSVTIANLVSATAWVLLVRWKIGAFGMRHILWRHLQYGVYAILAAAAGAAVVWAMGGYERGGFGTQSLLSGGLTCIAAGTAMAIVYFGMLYITKNPDFRSTIGILTSRLGRRRTMEPSDT